jgi:hypothetical protein
MCDVQNEESYKVPKKKREIKEKVKLLEETELVFSSITNEAQNLNTESCIFKSQIQKMDKKI